MNIYGNGNTKYTLLKGNYVIFPKFGAIQAFTTPQFIQKINTDPLNRVLLVYHDKNCLKPYIEGFVNNQKAFEIELSKKQYEEANNKFIYIKYTIIFFSNSQQAESKQYSTYFTYLAILL